MKNHILDITIAAESLTTMSTAANTFTTEVNGFGIHLDESERKHTLKIGTRNETFAREIMEFALQRPDLMPAGISVTALQRDLVARDQLTPLLFKLKALVRTVEDTHAGLGIDLFNGTRGLYKAVKPIAEINGVQDVIKRIGQRFASQGRKKTVAAATSMDSAAL